MNKNIYYILEVANTHGGDLNYVINLLDDFAIYKDRIGVKFQPLNPDALATQDFEWYKVYQEISFSESEWLEIITKANSSKDVWLDIFDLYGVNILKENLCEITGIKFQSSVLLNYEVLEALKNIDTSKLKLIINIAAREVSEISEILDYINTELNPQEVLLEIGFQSYPTKLEDSGVSKIKYLKDNFSNRIVFADHVDGNSEDALILPLVVSLYGVDMIEKHVMREKGAKYDAFSSINSTQFSKMISMIEKYGNLENQDFINDREVKYLKRSDMIPFLNKKLTHGQLVDPKLDLNFRRTNKKGLSTSDLIETQSKWHILASSKETGDTIDNTDYKKAVVATIIACRLKSTRLKEKALLKIGDLSSVEYCISNALKFKNVNHTILATSTVEVDQKLKNYTFSPSVHYHTGDPEDVIQRYLDVCQDLKIDVVIRITADMPFVDNEICQILLDNHFKSGADYTTAKKAAVGTNLEIMNVEALKRIKTHFPQANYSEYMTWYFQNNPDHFKLNFVELPEDLVRDYRLTLDYKEDLEMFNKIHNDLIGQGLNLRNIFEYLDSNKDVAEMNSHLKLKYKTDQELIDTLNRETKIK